MYENNYWLRYYFFDEANQYNSKPPLVIWLQTLSIALLGKQEWAIRLPSVTAFVMLLVVYYRWLRSLHLPTFIFPAVVLATVSIPGLLRPHVFLTGDLDAMLVLFTTAIQCYALYGFSQQEIPPRFIRNLFLLFLGAYLTKSTACFLILPALLVFAIGFGKWQWLLQQKALYLYALLFVLILGGYYGVRELQDPGHFQVVVHSEFLRLYEKVMHWHVQPYSFYVELMWDRDNRYGLLLSGILLPLFFLNKETQYKKLAFLLLVGILSNLLLISLPPVKLEWYPAPIYPLQAMLHALLFVELARVYIQKQQPWFAILLLAIVLIPAWFAHKMIAQRMKQLDDVEQEAALMKALPERYSAYSVLKKDEHDEVAYIYARWIKSSQRRIQLKHSISALLPGEYVLVCDPDFRDSLQHLSQPIWKGVEGELRRYRTP